MLTITTIALALWSGVAQADEGEEMLERFMIETAVGGGSDRDSAFTERLEDFGFDRGLVLYDGMPMAQAAGVISLSRYLAGVVTIGTIDSDSFHRDMLQLGDESFDERFSWTTWRMGLYGRYSLPLASGWLVPYVQGGGGPAMALTTYSDPDCEKRERQIGWHAAAAAGLQMMISVPGRRHVGFFTQLEAIHAPVRDNLTGDSHDSGGRAVMLGVRAGY